jgi:tetratricopeptide (TPR) repeat protein
MKRHTLLFALIGSLLAPCGFAQSPPLDRTEILGRLALGYSPSYVAHLVKTGGVSFTVSADFLSLVTAAGGDGILVERLSSIDASPSAVSSSEQDKPLDHLAKCAELLHTGATESAEPECRAAIAESPRSPWPLLIVATFNPSIQFVLHPSASDKAKGAERAALLAQAAALAPDLQAVQFYQSGGAQLSNASPDQQRADALDLDQLLIAQNRDYLPPPSIFEGSPHAPVALGEPSALNPEFLRPVELEPELASNHTRLAQQYAAVNDIGRAQSEFREAIRLEPDNPDLHTDLAFVFLDVHDRDACLAELREAAQIVPLGVNEHIALASGLESSGRTAEAIAELKTLVNAHPADSLASNALVEMYAKHKDRKSAIEELRRSLKASSAAFTDDLELVDARYQDEQQLAALLHDDRQFDAATEQYRFLLRLKPDDAGLHNDFGNVLLSEHNLDAAMGEYYAALRLEPEMSTPHNNIGLCLTQKKDLDGAIAEFRKALDLNPNEQHTQIFLGNALAEKGDLKAAKDQFQDAIQKNPKDAEARVGVAFALAQLKDEAGAITQLKAALELEPDSPGAENNLAWIYATSENPKLRNPAEALILARRAVATSPSVNPAFLDTLAEAQLLSGETTEALATETRAAALDPDNSEFQSRLPRFRKAAAVSANSKP